MGEETSRRRLTADGYEDGSRLDGGSLRRLSEVYCVDGACLGTGAAEGAPLHVHGPIHPAVIELCEYSLAPGVVACLSAHRFAGAAVDAPVGYQVGKGMKRDLEVAGTPRHRLDRRAAADVKVGVVDGQVPVKALADSQLGVRGGQALAAIVGRKDRSDESRPAAEERPLLYQLDVMTHLGYFHRRLGTGHAPADNQYRINAGLVRPSVRFWGWVP